MSMDITKLDDATLNSTRSISQQAAQLTTTSTSDEDDDSYQAIVNKANSGQELTSGELNTLKAKNPALYAQAVQAKQARQNLRQQMEADPSHAAQAARQAITDAYQAEDAAGGQNAELVRNALDDEYRGFAKSYDQVALSGYAQQFIEED